jgi:uncharacterized delta-60 repeat protein
MIREHDSPFSLAAAASRLAPGRGLLCVLLLASSPVLAQGPSIDDGFGSVVAASFVDHTLLADGGILVAGDLMVIDGVARGRLVRLLPDGTLDPGFDPAPDGFVKVVLEQPDGKILVGGDFTTIGGQPRGRLARLHPDGSLDTGFQPEVAPSGLVTVEDLALQPDGKILVAGVFDSLAGVAADGLGRLLSDGTFDPAFQPPNDLQGIRRVVLQPDGRILIGGTFFFPAPVTDLARLESDGSIDASFAPDLSGTVEAIAVQADRRIVVGGTFTTSQTSGHLARVEPDGSLDAEFDPLFDDQVQSIEIQADGRILAGGRFTEVDGEVRRGAARFLPDGALDPTFIPTYRSGSPISATSITEQSDGMILLSGEGGTRRLHAGGTVDVTLDTGVESFVFALAVQPDGRLVVGGAFGVLAGAARVGLGRLLPDGHLDAAFSASIESATMANERVFSLLVQEDGRIVVGGSFDTLSGSPRSNLGRVLADGSLDGGFAPLGANGSVAALALEPDGDVLVGGDFSQLGGVARSDLGRLHPDGSIDPAFVPAANGSVNALAVQPDGKIVVGGDFTALGGELRQNLARLLPDGTVDEGFDPLPDDRVSALAVQPDGKILVGGYFRSIAGGPRDLVARLHADGTLDQGFDAGAIAPASARVRALAVQSDGKILVGGSYSNFQGLTRWSIGRLHPDGSLDHDFDLGFLAGLVTPGQILAFAQQPDGKIVAAGFFTAVDGVERDSLMRFRGSPPPSSRLEVGGTGVTWFRDGGLELDRVDLEGSADGISWSDVGPMTRIGAIRDWTRAVAVPAGVPVWFRARGHHAASGSQLVAGRMHWIPPDSDGDGLTDEHELRYGLDPGDPGDAALDADGDGLTSLAELLLHPWLDPTDPDTDGDGLDDGLDPDPLIAGDACTGGTSAAATFQAVVTGAAACSASESIVVQAPAAVEPTGELLLVAPRIVFEAGFRVSGRLRVISKHPCAACP